METSKLQDIRILIRRKKDKLQSSSSIPSTPTTIYSLDLVTDGDIRKLSDYLLKEIFFKAFNLLDNHGAKIKELGLLGNSIATLVEQPLYHKQNDFHDKDSYYYKNFTSSSTLTHRGDLRPVEGNNDVGFIASEVLSVYPELVTTDKDGRLVVSYPKITAALAARLNDHERRISKLEEDVLQLLTDVSNLQSDVSELQSSISWLQSRISGLSSSLSALDSSVSSSINSLWLAIEGLQSSGDSKESGGS